MKLLQSMEEFEESIDHDGSIEDQEVGVTDLEEEVEIDPETLKDVEELVEIEENLIEGHYETIQDEQETERVIETVEALEALLEQIETMPEELGAEEKALIETAGEFANAGTDADAGDIVPTADMMTDKEVAIEGIMDKIRMGGQSMGQSFTERWVKLGLQLDDWSDMFSSYKSKLAKLKAQVENMPQDKVSFDVFLGKKAYGRFGPITNKEIFIKTFKADMQDCAAMLTSINKDLNLFQGALRKQVASFTSPVDYKENMIDNFEKINNQFLTNLSKNNFDRVFDGKYHTTYSSSTFMGLKAIQLKVSKAKLTMDGTRSDLRAAFDDFGMVVYNAKEDRSTSIQNDGRVVFDSITKKELLDLINQLDKTLTVITNFSTSSAKNVALYRNILTDFGKLSTSVYVGYNAGQLAFLTHKAFSFLKPMIANPTKVKLLLGAGFVAGTTAATIGGLAANELAARIAKAFIGFVLSSSYLQQRIGTVLRASTTSMMFLQKGPIDSGMTVVAKAIKASK